MYCPRCRTEYREGFFKCADCKVPLVDILPPEEPGPPPEYVDLKEIITGLNSGEIVIIRSILDDNHIPYVAEGETPIGVPGRILVPKGKVIKAMELLKDLLKPEE